MCLVNVSVQMGECQIDRADGEIDFRKLDQLRHLRLRISRNVGMPSHGIPALRALALWDFDGTNLDFLKNYPALLSLEITEFRRLKTLSGIENCKGLSKFELAYTPALQTIEDLKFIKSLETLEIINSKKIEQYTWIGNLHNLRRLIIEKSNAIQTLLFLEHLQKLEHLVIRNTPILDCDLSLLKDLPFLSHIYFDNKKEYEPVLGELKKLTKSRKTAN